jgi:hypothetical protein
MQFSVNEPELECDSEPSCLTLADEARDDYRRCRKSGDDCYAEHERYTGYQARAEGFAQTERDRAQEARQAAYQERKREEDAAETKRQEEARAAKELAQRNEAAAEEQRRLAVEERQRAIDALPLDHYLTRQTACYIAKRDDCYEIERVAAESNTLSDDDKARITRSGEFFRNRDAPSSNRMLLCNDGTTSPTCECGASRRGCCSHHGGVAGCEP